MKKYQEWVSKFVVSEQVSAWVQSCNFECMSAWVRVRVSECMHECKYEFTCANNPDTRLIWHVPVRDETVYPKHELRRFRTPTLIFWHCKHRIVLIRWFTSRPAWKWCHSKRLKTAFLFYLDSLKSRNHHCLHQQYNYCLHTRIKMTIVSTTHVQIRESCHHHIIPGHRTRRLKIKQVFCVFWNH